MVVKAGAVWAIDIGNDSLKALHLSSAGGVVEVIGFDNIRHGKILSGTGVKNTERDELIALSLRQFVKQNNLGKEDVVVSVPSQNSFARFVNLPPVETKRIPEIVKFEAAQQIPFDINDVQWDWQMMTEPGSAEVKVGIFAVKGDIVTSTLEHFSREDILVSCVQMAPMALYNYILYDRSDLLKSDGQAIVVLNIGAENTDLVVCTQSTVWQRCIPMGGNAFTKAIADAFKLNFEKAEKLKRTAPMSKYARQILQAMKPIFTDLSSEIQRSLGFYSNSNPNTKASKIIALGGGTKMRGLLKYLQQTLQIPIERPDSFAKLAMSPSVSAAKFHESVCDFGIVYGLALQGLGQARITSNLLPRNIARSMAWAGKARYFIAAACVLLLVSVLSLVRTVFDRITYGGKSNIRQEVKSIIDTAAQADGKLKEEEAKGANSEAIIKKEFEVFKYRDVIPLLHQTIISALPNERNNPEQKQLYGAFANGDVEAILKIPRNERKQIFVTSMSVFFSNDIASASFSGVSLQTGSSAKKAGGEMGGEYGYEGGGAMPGYVPGGSSEIGQPTGTSETGAAAVGTKAGFVVVMAGYCPYKSIDELMDPAGAGDDRSKWGIITRLLHLDEIVDGNSPFELYEKTKLEHFKLEMGEVSLDAQMPIGVGVLDVRKVGGGTGSGQVLIDPLTRELISRVADVGEDGKEKMDKMGKVIYKVNDHWFILSAKFVWKDAPKTE